MWLADQGSGQSCSGSTVTTPIDLITHNTGSLLIGLCKKPLCYVYRGGCRGREGDGRRGPGREDQKEKNELQKQEVRAKEWIPDDPVHLAFTPYPVTLVLPSTHPSSAIEHTHRLGNPNRSSLCVAALSETQRAAELTSL